MERVPSRSDAAGFSLIEVVIASALLTIMIIAVSTLSISGAEAQGYASRLNRVTEITQGIADDLRLEIVSCVRVFGNDAEGNGNLALLDLTGAPTPLTGLRLATVAANEPIRRDTVSTQITGNSLFFAKLAWSDRFVCASSREYLVDVYRWVYFYLMPEEGGPSPANAIGLNLVRVVSEPLVNASSIDRITDATDLAEVLVHLHDGTADANGNTHDPCEVVWRRGASPAAVGTLRQIDPSDGSLSDTPLIGRPDPWKVLRSDDPVQGLLSYRHHSVASNFSRACFGVGRYAVTSLGGSGFPHGLEVQVVGPSSARQVLVHLVVATANRRGQVGWSNLQIVVDARDL